MYRFILILMLITMIAVSCKTGNKGENNVNPLLMTFETPYGVPPFDKIKPGHFMPAYQEAIRQHENEIKAIVGNKAAPDFENTIAAFDFSGELLETVSSVFNNLTEANTSDTLQKIAQEVAPLISRHYDNIGLDSNLFARIKVVNDNKDRYNLTTEQQMLLKKVYEGFVRNGANLDAQGKARLREINEQISTLTLQYGDHVLAETNNFKLVIDDSAQLEGLPQGLIDAAAQTASDLGMGGKWVFTLQAPSLFPFLQYSARRDLREKIWTAYTNRGNNNDANDNKEIIKQIVALRAEKAKLLGYETFAHYVISDNMAKTPEKVLEFLEKLWKPSVKAAKAEAAELQKLINEEGGKFNLQPWDWRYYAEKLRKKKYDLDEEQLKPFFELNSVIKGMQIVANKLYGLTFNPIDQIPKPHPDAVAYEVRGSDNTLIAILYMDFFPRESKRGGAWMDNYRGQMVKNGVDIRPVVTMVMNFSKPSGSTPSLLTFDEVETLYHEFGHALHGMLSRCIYPGLSGTAVARDFVELPSQIMENWVSQKEVLNMFARHYQTGEAISEALLKKINDAQHFNQGFITTEYLAASILDLKFHMLTQPMSQSPVEFEAAVLKSEGLIPQIISRYRSTYFSHIFAGGYSAGYYVYIWAGVLDSDAFDLFLQKGIFDQATATAFRTNILERGGTEDPMDLYRRFRGADPSIEPLLKKRGLDKIK